LQKSLRVRKTIKLVSVPEQEMKSPKDCCKESQCVIQLKQNADNDTAAVTSRKQPKQDDYKKMSPARKTKKSVAGKDGSPGIVSNVHCPDIDSDINQYDKADILIHEKVLLCK